MAKVSAGLIMYRRREGHLEVFLVHPGGPFWASKDTVIGQSSVPKRNGLSPPIHSECAQNVPITIDAKEFTEQTEPRVKRVCAGKLRRNSFRISDVACGIGLPPSRRTRLATCRACSVGMVVDIDEAAALRYQENRLREMAAPKSINEEVRFLLKMLGVSGEVIREGSARKSS